MARYYYGGNAVAATIFLIILYCIFYPIIKTIMFVNLPKDMLLAALGVSWGEYIIIALMVGIVFIWSLCHSVIFICNIIMDAVLCVYQNETVRNFVGAVGRKTNRTIGRKIRTTIREIYRDMMWCKMTSCPF